MSRSSEVRAVDGTSTTTVTGVGVTVRVTELIFVVFFAHFFFMKSMEKQQ